MASGRGGKTVPVMHHNPSFAPGIQPCEAMVVGSLNRVSEQIVVDTFRRVLDLGGTYRVRSSVLVFDAVGLSLFAVVGTLKVRTFHLGPVPRRCSAG